MGLFSLFTRRTTPTGGWPEPPPMVARATREERPDARSFLWSSRTHAGVTVDHDTALKYATVWACVQVICQDIGQMSWHVFQGLADGGKRYVPTHPVNWVLLTQANPEMSAMTFRETLLAWALLWGNAYAEIERDLAGRVLWLYPIAPDRVNPDRTQDGELVYDIANRGNSNTVLRAADIFHLKGLGFDGTMGYSVVSYARQSMGLGLAMEQFGASFFGNGARPSVVLEHPGELSEKAKANIRDDFSRKYGGKEQLGVAVLEEGMKLNSFSVQPNDAQFLESRQFQIEEICRWFRMQPHKIAHLLRATFSNIEQQSIEHVTDTLVPWCVRFEQEANIKLFGQNRANLFTKLNVNSLLRGDMASRNTAYRTGIEGGWLSVNDVRRLEDMNPLPPDVGDVYRRPLNTQFVTADGRILSPEPPPVEEPDEEEMMPATGRPLRNGALH